MRRIGRRLLTDNKLAHDGITRIIQFVGSFIKMPSLDPVFNSKACHVSLKAQPAYSLVLIEPKRPFQMSATAANKRRMNACSARRSGLSSALFVGQRRQAAPKHGNSISSWFSNEVGSSLGTDAYWRPRSRPPRVHRTDTTISAASLRAPRTHNGANYPIRRMS